MMNIGRITSIGVTSLITIVLLACTPYLAKKCASVETEGFPGSTRGKNWIRLQGHHQHEDVTRNHEMEGLMADPEVDLREIRVELPLNIEAAAPVFRHQSHEYRIRAEWRNRSREVVLPCLQ
jgi:hypothetical protein